MSWLKKNHEKMALIFILLITAFLTGYKIWEIGNANAYYTAAVKSMLMSWHNFFYASFDPGGFITVDKPALGLWLQCLFALIFGVHGWSVALPEIICSIISVAVLYHIVKRSFGVKTGLLAALFLSLTPIFIAATRTNNFDASLVLVCLLAIWATIVAAERGSLKHLILAMVLIGLGFNIKMLQAYLYAPALYLVYFFTSKASIKKRIVHLLIGTAVLLAVSVSWCLAVDLTPADSRPYVGSSETNSAIELALGYNGLARIFGMGTNLEDGVSGILSSISGKSAFMNEGGTPGPFRLFNAELSGQVSWLLVLAFFGLAVLLIKAVTTSGENKKAALRQLLLWSGLLIPIYAYFSVSKFFHRYYLIMLTPCLAVLTAVAVREGVRMFTRNENTGKNRWQNLLLPVSIILTALSQIYFLTQYYSAYSTVLVWIISISTALSISAFIVIKVFNKETKRLIAAAAAIGVLGLLAAPAYWAYSPIQYGSNASLPYAGPSDVSSFTPGAHDGADQPDNTGIAPGANGNFSGNSDNLPNDNNIPNADNLPNAGINGDAQAPASNKPPIGQGGNADNALPGGNLYADANSSNANSGSRQELSDEMIRYMVENDNGSNFLVVVSNANVAAPIILDYGVGVMAIGGFKGSDKAISLEDFIARVKAGEIQYFWSSGNGNSQITRWVENNGVRIKPVEWLGNGSQVTAEIIKAGSLYDLSGLADS